MSPAQSLVSLMLVLVAAGCVTQAQERIKICGRDLIRLAVSSCGNSRLRRSVMDVEFEQDQYTSLWDRDASTEDHQALGMLQTPPESEAGDETVAPLAPHWYSSSSRLRRAPGKISDICCEKGCSMRELIQFC